MKLNAISKPSMAEQLLANAPEQVEQDHDEIAFNWDHAVISKNRDELKTQLVILDSDILNAFKAMGSDWQMLINHTLRQSLIAQGKL